jgi:MFS family permease
MRNTFYTLLSIQFLVTFALMLLIPVMPLYLQQLNNNVPLSGFWSAAAIAAPAIGALLSAPMIGKGCDRFEKKNMLMLTQCLFVISLFAMALASSLISFLVARLLLGFAGISVVLTVYFCHASYQSEALQLAKQQRVIALACLFGPLVGGYALDSLSMHSLLLFSAISSAVLLGISNAIVRDLVKPLLAVEPSVINGRLWSWPLVGWLAAGCAVQAAAFALVVAFALYYQAQWSGNTKIASQIGALHATAWLATFLFASFWGKRNQSSNPRLNFMLASAGCGLALLCVPWVNQLWLFVLARFCQGACFAALPQTLFLQVGKLCPINQRGAALGLARSSQVVGQLLGPLSVALVYDLFGADSVLWPVVLWFFAGSCFVILPTLFISTSFKVTSK